MKGWFNRKKAAAIFVPGRLKGKGGAGFQGFNLPIRWKKSRLNEE